jgi:hypothetical protein
VTDASLQTAMSQVHPGITKETTMWRAWVGLNASNRMGAILFGLTYAFLALFAHNISSVRCICWPWVLPCFPG